MEQRRKNQRFLLVWVGLMNALMMMMMMMIHKVECFSSVVSRTGVVAAVGRNRMQLSSGVRVWVEEAEEDFVDKDENLESGEVCLRAVKAFASDPDFPSEKRFLCAGALIQRPSGICDAWTADSLLDNGGPNLQVIGALQVLDDLFQCHLEMKPRTIEALQTFCVQCGSGKDESSCASHMAAMTRGFRPLRRQVQVDSIFQEDDYDDSLDGMVFDFEAGRRHYQQVVAVSALVSGAHDEVSLVAKNILELLPDEESVAKSIVVKEME